MFFNLTLQQSNPFIFFYFFKFYYSILVCFKNCALSFFYLLSIGYILVSHILFFFLNFNCQHLDMLEMKFHNCKSFDRIYTNSKKSNKLK